MRRTTTHDSARPQGLLGPVVVTTSGRDLFTAADGSAVVFDEARLDVVVQYVDGRLTALTAVPPHPELANLVGASVYVRFRRAVESALPGESASHTVRFQLLDELPAAVLASGRALRAARIPIDMKGRTPPIDICAGWAAGGTAAAGMTDFGPPLHVGPAAPAIESDDDPLGWHYTAPIPPHGTRRARRLDLWEEGDRARIECFFRDSHVDAEGTETVVHEWAVQAVFDPGTRRFVSGAAQTGPLPYPECPSAAASAGRLAGMSVDGLRSAVQKSFVGPATCTHLNGTFRSMEDVGALLVALRSSGAPGM
jgi:hypothetical protein